MYSVPGKFDPQFRLTPPGFGPDIDVKAIFDWLGVRVATLKAPDWRTQLVGQRFSDSAAGSEFDTTPELESLKPVYITLRYKLDDDLVVDVSTRRVYDDGTTPLQHMWQTVVDYQLASADSAGVPWLASPSPADVQDRLDLHRLPAASGARLLTVDGVPVTWEQITDTDLGTGIAITAYGGRIEQSLLAVVGPEQSLAEIVIETWSKENDMSSPGSG